MDVAGALLEGVLQQPVDDIDDVLVVGIGLFHGAQFQHLLEIGHPDPAVGSLTATGAAHRARHGVELGRVAGDRPGVGEHPPHALAQHMLEVAFPAAHKGLAAGDNHFLGTDLHRQNPVALRESPGHDLCDRSHVYLQRVDLVNRLLHPGAQPCQQAIHIQHSAGAGRVLDFLLRQVHQRVHLDGLRRHHAGQVPVGEPALGVKIPCQGGQAEAVFHQLLAKIRSHRSDLAPGLPFEIMLPQRGPGARLDFGHSRSPPAV